MVTYFSYEFNHCLLTLNSLIEYQQENMYNTSTFILSSITHDIINLYICIAKLTASVKLNFYQNIIIFSNVKHDITKIGNFLKYNQQVRHVITRTCQCIMQQF